MRIIYFDVCAIILSMTVFVFLVSRKYTKGRTNRLILVLAILFMIAGLLDVFDSLFGTYVQQDQSNATIQFISNSLFYIIRNLTTPVYILFIYSYFGVWHRLKRIGPPLLMTVIPFLAVVVSICMNCFNGLVFYIDNNGVYHRGKMIIVIYIAALVHLIYDTFLICKYRKIVRKTEFVTLLSFVFFNLVAVIAQRINGAVRVEILALALTLFMIATAIQRPEDVVDAAVGTLSQHAFFTDMFKAYGVGRPMNVLFIKIQNHRALRTNLGLEIYNTALGRVGEKLINTGRIMELYTDVYYLGRGVFVIVADGDKYEKVMDMGRLVAAYLKESFMLSNLEIRFNSKICLARLPENIGSYNALLSFVNSFHKTIPDMDQVIVLSDILDSKDFKMKNEIDEIIKRGVKDSRFRMFYQPIYSVKEDRFVSAEALIRLWDDEYGYVSPALFIPAAEDSGAIHDIGDFVLEDVCRFIHRTEFLESGLKYIEINLSVAQCIETDLVDKIRSLISKYNVRTSQINLEITETAVDYDPEITDRNISGLHNMGFKFSLDDYGTGYSNIKRVVSLPLDIVKFDKSFVDEMDDPKMWAAIVNTVDMLKKMNKKILVEGVEDERILKRFIELGCDYIQGFYFSKPLSQSDFVSFVNEHRSGKDFGI
ncbi:MAG: EAL domain-containing protein [Lachnospiraceae bacterium]|nr:EAL domain-containing protein [Lachnospiraceae bacterium]